MFNWYEEQYMTYEEINQKLKIISDMNVCDCQCHVDDQGITHRLPCCGMKDEKYVDSNYNFDKDRYESLCKKHKIKPYNDK